MDEKNLINKIKKEKGLLSADADSRLKIAVLIFLQHGKEIFVMNRNGLFVEINKIDLKILLQICEILDEKKAADQIDFSDIADIINAPDTDAASKKLAAELKAFAKLNRT
jgi:hypothetical protein